MTQHELLVSIHRELGHIKRRIEKMATKDDLDSAISAVSDAVTKLGADMTKALADLQAKFGSAAPEDFTPELTTLGDIAAKLTSFDAGAVAADPGDGTTETPA